MARVTMLLDNDFTRDTRVRKEASSLAAAGHLVTVVAVRSPGSAPREAAGDVRVRRARPPKWVSLRGPAQLLTHLLWFERMAFLGRAAAGLPADVVHAHDLTTLAPAVRLARRRRAALVYDDHELYLEKLHTGWPTDRGRVANAAFAVITAYLRAVGTRLESRAVRGLDGHVTVSVGLAAEIARRYGVPPPLVVANCRPFAPPAPADGRLRRAAGAAPGEKLVLYVGTFPGAGAGQEELVDVLGLLPPTVRMVCLGPGWGREALRRRARAKGLAGRMAFPDPVPPEEVPACLADADAAVIPNHPTNLSHLHALPNKLFESMLAGTPVVAARTPALEAFLAEFPAGVLYRHDDLADFAGRLREVLEAPPSRREAFRAAGRRAVSGPWSWEAQAAKLVALYDGILSRRRHAAPAGGPG